MSSQGPAQNFWEFFEKKVVQLSLLISLPFVQAEGRREVWRTKEKKKGRDVILVRGETVEGGAFAI